MRFCRLSDMCLLPTCNTHTQTLTHTHTDICNIATLHKLQVCGVCVCVCTWSQSTYTFIFLSGLCVHMIYNNVTAAHKRDGGGGRGVGRREAGEEQALKFFL